MNYNIHPILVHFPIALLLLYSFLRIFPWPKKLKAVDWTFPRIIILLAGIVGGWVSNATGEIASNLTNHPHNILEMHESFAGASVNIYFILLIAEVVALIDKSYLEKIGLKVLLPILNFLQKKSVLLLVFYILSIAGVMTIAMTGLLGGVMVHGTSADPLAEPVLKLLGL